ncbi:MAG: cytochrome P450 [Marmoricola sp.]
MFHLLPEDAVTAQPALPVGFDPTDPDLNQAGIPLQEFLELRRTAPVWWVEQRPEARAGFLDTGFWAVSRHEDIAAVSKDSKNFSTNENGVIIRFAADMTREQVELQRAMLIHHDPPEHTKLRQIISRGFTPRSIGAMRDTLVERAHRIADDALAKGEGDFVFDVAAELPLQAIADLLGVPQEDRRKLFDWSNQMLAYDDPEYDAQPDVAAAEILGYAMALAEERRANPQDDIISKLVTADVDGHGALNDDEFGFFVILLAVAGNETTRNAITHGMKAFFDHPEQWELYKRERPRSAVDEIIRWATPVTVFQRTELHDVEVGGQLVKLGQRVGIFYASGNHDADVFTEPDRFDILRDPNPHLAFGGHGAHYCIGANLARLEVEIMFEVIADRMPAIRPIGEPRRLRHAWINGIKELPVSYVG